MSKEEFDKQIHRARERVKSFDDIAGTKDRHLVTVLSALRVGLLNPETGAQFDALVMLQDAVNQPQMAPSQKYITN